MLNRYISLLKSHPLSTNLITASVLMVGGDCLAQLIERHHLEDAFSFHEHDLDGVPESRRLHLHPYGHRNDDDEAANTSTASSRSSSNGTKKNIDDLSQIMKTIQSNLQNGVQQNDWVRSGTMGVWSVVFYTPAYMALYAAFDRIFLKKTLFSIAARVAGALVYSIPVNAAFFFYGTSVHHTLEWVELWDAVVEDAEEEAEWTVPVGEEEWSILARISERMAAAKAKLSPRKGNDNLDTDEDATKNPRELVDNSKEEEIECREEARHHFFLPIPEKPPPYDFDMLLSKARLKIEKELVTTVTNSATVWVPINLLTLLSCRITCDHLGCSSLASFGIAICRWCSIETFHYRKLSRH